jgi:hypothetical protein
LASVLEASRQFENALPVSMNAIEIDRNGWSAYLAQALANLMRHSDIRTTLNIYGDVVTDKMAVAHSKVVGMALRRKVIANQGK